ncbi:MAG: hypothetical protein E7273_06790 [Pseudobutyrivibrio ruminis]|nr:hypothetical protein [Pseudobutyrivibrio ruminis]
MARKKREWYQEAVYHVMSRGNRQMPIFKDNSDYKQFMDYLAFVKEKHPFKLHAFCLMTNHFHLEIETNRVLNMFKNQGKEGYRMFVEGKISHEEQELLIMKDIGENELWLPWKKALLSKASMDFL